MSLLCGDRGAERSPPLRGQTASGKKQKNTSISPPAANYTCSVFHAAVAAKTQITRQPGTFKAASASGLHTSKLAILSSSFTALSVKHLFCFSILFIVSSSVFTGSFCLQRRLLPSYRFNLSQT